MSSSQVWQATAKADSLASAALSLVVRVEDVPLRTLVRLRATNRHLRSVITGHLPPGLVHRLRSKKGRIQVGCS